VKLTVALPDWSKIPSQLEADMAKPITLGMRQGTAYLQASLRQRTGAVLGGKVAGAWRSKNFPSQGYSLDPAGLVWSKASKIVHAFDKGVTIVPINGSKNLAIPTDNVPRKGRSRMTPFEVESAFNQDLIIKRGQGGRLEAFIDKAITRYYASQGRAYGKGRAQRRIGKAQLVLMFTFVRSARTRGLLQIDAFATSAAVRVPSFIASNWSAA
jgi:hypothetical protein